MVDYVMFTTDNTAHGYDRDDKTQDTEIRQFTEKLRALFDRINKTLNKDSGRVTEDEARNLRKQLEELYQQVIIDYTRAVVKEDKVTIQFLKLFYANLNVLVDAANIPSRLDINKYYDALLRPYKAILEKATGSGTKRALKDLSVILASGVVGAGGGALVALFSIKYLSTFGIPQGPFYYLFAGTFGVQGSIAGYEILVKNSHKIPPLELVKQTLEVIESDAFIRRFSNKDTIVRQVEKYIYRKTEEALKNVNNYNIKKPTSENKMDVANSQFQNAIAVDVLKEIVNRYDRNRSSYKFFLSHTPATLDRLKECYADETVTSVTRAKVQSCFDDPRHLFNNPPSDRDGLTNRGRLICDLSDAFKKHEVDEEKMIVRTLRK